MTRSIPPFDPAFALVAACALFDHARLRDIAPALIGRPGFDWQRLEKLAFYHEVEQAVRLRLDEAAPGAMPNATAARIQQALVHTSALMAAHLTISVRLTRALADAGVRSLLIKGVGLSHLLYEPHPELRPANDIDIVVAPEDLAAADRALRQAGLTRSWPQADPPEAARAMHRQLANVWDYRGPVLNELVELHMRPTINPYWLPVPFAALLAATTEIDTGEGRLRALDGPLNVHYLCQHALYYFGFRLKWYGDITRAVRREGASDCAACVARYPHPLPEKPGLLADAILRALGEGVELAVSGGGGVARANADAVRIIRRMLPGTESPPGRRLSSLATELGNHFLVIRHLPGWRGKARQILLALSDPRDAASLRLGPRFAPLYGLLGPFLSLFRFVMRGIGTSKPSI
jgi:hypothetical protein